jgi:hypothetical protein
VLPLGTRSPCPWSESDQLRSTPAHYPVAGQHHGNTVRVEDLGGTQPWHIWIRYSTALQHLQGIAPHRAHRGKELPVESEPIRLKRDPYSQTMTDYRTSDSATFAFPGQPETFFKVRIDVPNHLGARSGGSIRRKLALHASRDSIREEDSNVRSKRILSPVYRALDRCTLLAGF